MKKVKRTPAHQVVYDLLLDTVRDHKVKFAASAPTVFARVRITTLMEVISRSAPKRLRRTYARRLRVLASSGTSDPRLRQDIMEYVATLSK